MKTASETPASESSDATSSQTLRTVFGAVAVVGAVFTLAGGLLAGTWAFGIAVGAVLALANLAGVAYIVRGFTKPGASPGAVVVVALLKLTLLFGGLYLLLSSGWVDVLAVAVGFGALPLGIVIGQLKPASAGE